MVTESGTKVDESVYGGNASAEGGAEEIEEAGATYECNIVIANRLVRTESFTKKTYQAHIKVNCQTQCINESAFCTHIAYVLLVSASYINMPHPAHLSLAT